MFHLTASNLDDDDDDDDDDVVVVVVVVGIELVYFTEILGGLVLDSGPLFRVVGHRCLVIIRTC